MKKSWSVALWLFGMFLRVWLIGYVALTTIVLVFAAFDWPIDPIMRYVAGLDPWRRDA